MGIPKLRVVVRLFDFYHSLLTKKQQKVFMLYYFEDLSLGEISGILDISRQAVYDLIKRTEKILMSYESKLKLYGKFKKDTDSLNKIKQFIKTNSMDSSDKETICLMVDEILDRLI